MNVVKVGALENCTIGDVKAETLDVTWDLPAGIQLYNVSIIHNIKWVQSTWADEHPFAGVRELIHHSGPEVTQ